MIGAYSDHAANERTFLAWVRTGITVIAFGFVVERFDLFLRLMARSSTDEGVRRAHLPGLGRFEGIAFICGGIGIIVLSTVRFMRTTRLIDDQAMHSVKSVRAELVLAAWFVILVTGYSVYLAFS